MTRIARNGSWAAVLTFLYIASAFAQDQKCYFPDGTQDTRQRLRVCDPGAAASHCCGGADLCASNGLCKSPVDHDTNWYWRQSCTDQAWRSKSCPKLCRNSDTGVSSNGGNWVVFACNATAFCCSEKGSATSYKHFNNTECCDGSNGGLFDLGPARYQAGTSFSTYEFSTETSSSATNAAAATSGPATTTASATASTTTSPSPSSSSSSSTTTPSTSSDPPPSSGLSTGAKAGIGVGAAVVGATLVVAGIFFGRRMSHQRGNSSPGGAAAAALPTRANALPHYGSPASAAIPGAGAGYRPVHEMEDERKVHEVDAAGVRAELPGAEPGDVQKLMRERGR